MTANSCQVDFYVLVNAEQTSEEVACRLALKAWEQGHRVIVLAAGDHEANAMDKLLWDFPARRFLPHARGAAATDIPVSIEIYGSESPEGRDVLINLTEQPVQEPGRFKRLLEIVPEGEQQRMASRQKFRVYRDLGFESATHQIT
jgi:DNA polymerase-3 subunit chi